MKSLKIRIYLFYVAAVLFAALGLWMIGRGLFGDGGFTALLIGGLMFATGVVDYAMGNYLQRIYLQQQPAATASAPPRDSDTGGQPG